MTTVITQNPDRPEDIRAIAYGIAQAKTWVADWPEDRLRLRSLAGLSDGWAAWHRARGDRFGWLAARSAADRLRFEVGT
jgi:hypothetical protein